MGVRGYIKREEVLDTLAYQRGLCYYCQSPLNRNRYTIDHVIPLSRGGFHDVRNIVCACKRCNEIKGAMSEEDAFKVIKSDGGLWWCKECNQVKGSPHFGTDEREPYNLSRVCRQCEYEQHRSGRSK